MADGGFAGSPRQAVIIGTAYVMAGYGLILGMLATVATAAGSVTAIWLHENCRARAAIDSPRDPSWLYGAGPSPLCGNGSAVAAAALLLALAELALVLLLIRGSAPVGGQPVGPAIESRVRQAFAPFARRLAGLTIEQSVLGPRVTPRALLVNPTMVAEFAGWTDPVRFNTERWRTHYTIFATLHELGHATLGDVLYSRGADRAIPAVSGFVVLFMLVAMPAGALATDYWVSVILTGLECVVAFLATRCVLGCILTNFEFLMDNFAATRTIGMTGHRLTLPSRLQPGRRHWFTRSHPALAARRAYLWSLSCGDFLWTYLISLPVMVLLGIASTPSQPTFPAMAWMTAGVDVIVAAALCVQGVIGGAAAARHPACGAWVGYGLVVALMAALFLTGGFFDLLPFTADAARRLSVHGRPVLWSLVLAAPPAGVLLRHWTAWFDPDPAAAPEPPQAAPLRESSAPASVSWLRRVAGAVQRLGVWFHHGFVAFAGAAAAVFGFILLVYVLDTGIFSWVHLLCFTIYFAVPFTHAMRPLWRVPLILDQLFQALFLSATVVIMVALRVALDSGAVTIPRDDQIATGTMLMTGPAVMVQSILDGSLFRLHGPAIYRDILWLWVLLAAAGCLRLVGQAHDRRQQRERDNGHL